MYDELQRREVQHGHVENEQAAIPRAGVSVVGDGEMVAFSIASLTVPVVRHINSGKNLRNISFYRDSQKREMDLLIQNGNTLYPVEVKAAATVNADAIKNFNVLQRFDGYEVGFGSVVWPNQ